ncbi:MAG: Trk system potassium transporter TrkA [Deltaproteobacteria bacterium]|nr:Trk system potassium transporter TrkA [Deltaproteobacteria bacterium]
MKIIIIGAGGVGFYLAQRLALENKEVIVIDKNTDAVKRVAENIDAQTIVGSGGSPRVLKEAGLSKADIFLAVTNSDEANITACTVANIISPATKKIARIRNADFDAFHQNLMQYAPHIDTIINPETEVVNTIERLFRVPGAIEVNEFAKGKIKFIGVRLKENSRLSGLKLIDIASEIGDKSLLIAGIIREERLIIPTGQDRLKQGDLIYFISEEKRLAETMSLFDKYTRPSLKAMIIGGGNIGLKLAERLENKGLSPKLVEIDKKRALFLAEKLNKTIVLQGAGSDMELLAEENISDMDMVVTVTGDEETNILSSLLAKKMGVYKAITRIDRFDYFTLMPALGIDQVVSERVSAIDSILKYIRKGKVISAVSIKGETAEVLEAEALATSAIVGKPLKKASVPRGALIIGILREDQVIIPSGETVINPGDRIIIFATKEALPRVEKILTVKLEFF